MQSEINIHGKGFQWDTETFRALAIVTTILNLMLYAPLLNAGFDQSFSVYLLVSWFGSSALYLLSYRSHFLVGIALYFTGITTSWVYLQSAHILLVTTTF